MHRMRFSDGWCLLPLLVVILAGGCASTPDASGDVDPDLRATIVALNGTMEERLRAGDLAGVAAIYADDGLILGPGTRVDGREAIDAYWAGLSGARDWTLDVHRLEGGPVVVHQRGRSTLEIERDGTLHTSVVEFVIVWVRQDDGSYRIAVDAYW